MPKQKSTHVDDPVKVGARLRAAREQAGLSQRELSFPGCSPAYVSRIEGGARIPSLQLLRELGKRLGVSEDYLATGTEPRTEDAALMQAEVALRLADTELAELLYLEALAGAEGADRAHALGGLGQLAFRDGRPHDAIELLEEALELADGTQPQVADTLGRAYATVGEYESAIGLFERYRAVAEEQDDFIETVRFSVLLANALIDAGAFPRADEVLGSTLARLARTRDPVVHARLFWSQSRLHAARNDSAAAARYARKALDILELTEHSAYIARAHQLLAHIELDRNRPEEALDLVRRGVELLGPTGYGIERTSLLLEEARALAKLGHREEAAALALDAAGRYADVDPFEAGRGYALVAEISAELGDASRAIELYELAIELLAPRPNRYLLEAYSRLAELLEAAGRTDEALEVLKSAMRVQAEAGRPLA